MNQLEKRINKWHRETFPNATRKAVLLKLCEEMMELVEAISSGNDEWILNELSDVINVGIAFEGRYTTLKHGLHRWVAAKHEINRSRVWGKENSDGDRPRVK